jgi:FixJ family two-component response regulator
MAVNGSDRPEILIVEDNSAIRRSLQLLLVARGFQVRAHASSAQALADPASAAAACLVADLHMDEIDGITLLQSLKDRGWAGPAILITGDSEGERAQQAAETGYATVLQKPFVDALLIEAVSKAIAA